MSSAILSGGSTGTGNYTILAPSTNNNQTLTLPDGTGNIAMDGPAFSVTNSGTQLFSASTWTKVAFQTEIFDTNNCFDSTTNYRFTPNVAGYYQFSGYVVTLSQTDSTVMGLNLYKNGSQYLRMFDNRGSAFALYVMSMPISCVVYLNGSTDYVELYTYANGTTPYVNTGSTLVQFNGALIRGA